MKFSNIKESTMLKQILPSLLLISTMTFGQHSLDDFINRAEANSPVLQEYQQQRAINQIQQKISAAENSAFHLSLTGDYLFTPYFNNQGNLVTTNPSPQAIGYDINLFDGGLYSAQLNLERNIFNGKLMNALDGQIRIQDKNSIYNIDLEKHNLRKQVTDQYLNTYQSLLMIKLDDEIVKNLNEQLKLTGELIEKGFAKTQDYLLLQIEVKNQTINLRDDRQEYRSNMYQLYALCGIRDTLIVDIDSVTLTMNNQLAESNFLQQYTLDSLMTVNQQQLSEAKYQPQVNLFLNTGLNAVELSNIQRKLGLGAGMSLSLPLYDGHQKSLTRQQNLINRKTISKYRQFSEQNIITQRNDLISRIQALQQNISALTEQIIDYKKLLQLSEKQLRQGNISMIDHLTLLRNFIDIRKSKIETEINYQLEINNYNYWNW
jgi:outer membrane protein TolC